MWLRRPQDTPSDPEDIGIVQRLLPNGRVTPLEMQRVVSTATKNDVMYLKQLVIQGAYSPVRIYTDEPSPVFVVTCLPPFLLPTRYQLHPVSTRPRGDQRFLDLESERFLGTVGSEGIAFRVVPYGRQSFKLIPSHPLAVGEYLFKYGFSADESKDVYCFRIHSHKLRDAPPNRLLGKPLGRRA